MEWVKYVVIRKADGVIVNEMDGVRGNAPDLGAGYEVREKRNGDVIAIPGTAHQKPPEPTTRCDVGASLD